MWYFVRFGTICTIYQKMHNIHEICRKYVSWQVKPVAWSSNDFCMSWEKLKLYTFTPFSLIQRNTLELEQTWECVLVVPLWPSQESHSVTKEKTLTQNTRTQTYSSTLERSKQLVGTYPSHKGTSEQVEQYIFNFWRLSTWLK